MTERQHLPGRSVIIPERENFPLYASLSSEQRTSLPNGDITLKQTNFTKGTDQRIPVNASHALLPKQRELDKSNLRFSGRCNPRCCTRWPAWRSTSRRTRGTGPAARRCWWRWCRCCLCTHRSHSYRPDAPRSQMPRRRWSPFLVSPERKTWIYHFYYHLLGSLSHLNKIPNKYMLRQLMWSFSPLGTPAPMLEILWDFLWWSHGLLALPVLSLGSLGWGRAGARFLFFFLCKLILWPLALAHFFHSSLALCHYFWIFELPLLLSAWNLLAN